MLTAFQSAVFGDKLGFSSNFSWCAQLDAMESANIVTFIQQLLKGSVALLAPSLNVLCK